MPCVCMRSQDALQQSALVCALGTGVCSGVCSAAEQRMLACAPCIAIRQVLVKACVQTSSGTAG